jgi:hypothetical protein
MLLLYWIGVWVVILRSPELTQPWNDAAKWILRRALNLAHRLLRGLRLAGNAEFAHRYRYRYVGEHAFHGSCSCGWVSKEKHNDEHVEEEYRQHIIEAVGHPVRYKAPAVCTNCGYQGHMQISAGLPVKSETCPHCKCHGHLRAPEKLASQRRRPPYVYELELNNGKKITLKR